MVTPRAGSLPTAQANRRSAHASNGTTEVRYMAKVIYGKRHRKQYWLLTTALQTLPQHETYIHLDFKSAQRSAASSWAKRQVSG